MPTFVSGSVEVSVPATSANLGPGYDALGLALNLRDRVTAQVVGSGIDITISGVGAGELPTDENHLVHRAMRRAFDQMSCPVPGLSLRCVNAIPHARGLGSSSAAIVAGICAARGLVVGGSRLLDDDAVLTLAATIEGHPDNVAAAFYGGFTIAFAEQDRYLATVAAVDPRVGVVVFIPPEAVETKVARGLLPAAVPHADAAANAGRAALLVTALARHPELLLPATQDLLHQGYREQAMPASLQLMRELRGDGIPAVVSGAGPTVLAFLDVSHNGAIGERAPDGWRVESLAVDRAGAQVTVAR